MKTRLPTYLPLLTGILLAIPTLLVRYPPMADLPLHETIVGLLLKWNDPAFRSPDVYQLNLGLPNQAFYGIACIFGLVVGSTWGVKLTVASAVCLIPVLGDRCLRQLHLSPFLAALLAPLAMGWMYYWGLIANMLGVCGLLFGIPLLDRYARRPTLRKLPPVVLYMLVLYFLHESSLVAAVGFFCVSAALRPWRLRHIALWSVVPLGGAALLGIHMFLIAGLARFLPLNDKEDDLVHKLKILSGVLFSGFEDWVRHLLMGLGLIAIIASAIIRYRRRLPALAGRGWRLQRALYPYRFALCALMFLIAYFRVPMIVDGATLVYHRFLPLTWIFLVLAVSVPRSVSAPRLFNYAPWAFPIGTLIINIPQFLEADRLYYGFHELTMKVEVGSPVALTVLSPRGSEIFAVSTLIGHTVAVRGGRSQFDCTQSTISPVYVRERCDWPLTRQRYLSDTRGFRPAYDMRRFRYVFVFARERGSHGAVQQAMAPEGKLVDVVGSWMLFESTQKVRPLCGHDWRMPNPPPERLLDRVNRVEGNPPLEDPYLPTAPPPSAPASVSAAPSAPPSASAAPANTSATPASTATP
jgi:hypothetical protein